MTQNKQRNIKRIRKMETNKKNVQRKARWDVVGYNNVDKHQS